jgi:CBS-domain-containing membrane protein
MKVREIMTTDVVTAAPGEWFKDLVERMLARNVSCLPVVDGDRRVMGILSETDLLANEAFSPVQRGALALVGAALVGHDAGLVRKASAKRARDLMTPRVSSVGPDDDIHVAARRLLDGEINHLPVIENGCLVGIVSRQDLLQIFRRTDHALDEEINAKLQDPSWAPDDVRVSVSVRHGVVNMVGSVRHSADKPIVESMVRHVPGVVDVNGDIIVREPDPKVGPSLTSPWV